MSSQDERLKRLRESASPGMNLVFAEKLFMALSHTSQYPDDISIVGAFWDEDCFHFWTNSVLLGSFLCLKANSINKNFVMSNFHIVPPPGNCRKIPNMVKWRMREPVGFSFPIHMQLSEVRSHLLSSNSPKAKIVPSFSDVVLNSSPKLSFQKSIIHNEWSFFNQLSSTYVLTKDFARFITSFLTQELKSKEKHVINYVHAFFEQPLICEANFSSFCIRFGLPQYAGKFIAEILNDEGKENFWFGARYFTRMWCVTFGEPGLLVFHAMEKQYLIDVGLMGTFTCIINPCGLLSANSLITILVDILKLSGIDNNLDKITMTNQDSCDIPDSQLPLEFIDPVDVPLPQEINEFPDCFQLPKLVDFD